MTEEEMAAIAAKHRMTKFPNLALTRERLSRKAKAEPKFRFYTLYGRVMDMETLRCAWVRVRKKDKAPGVDGVVACAREPNGVMVKPKGRGTPQGGVISPLLSNIYLHWFETIASIAAKAAGQAMSIVRHADDFVILAKEWTAGFLGKVESILEGRMARFLNRKSQRYYRLKFADTYYGEMTHYGLHRLAWADVRRIRN